MIGFGSLFAGIGGFDLGLERAGMECRFQAELDPLRRAVLAEHWPEVAQHSDVRALAPERLPEVELICGGFPCTDLSFAGQGAGITGRHSGLWREFARIIRGTRPRWIIVENVPGLRSRGLGAVLADLAASGYDAEWDCVPATALGAPHRRDRLWLVAYPERRSVVRPAGSGVGGARRGDAARTGGADVADPGRERLQHRRAGREVRGAPRAAEAQGLQRQRSGPASGAGRQVADAESGQGGQGRSAAHTPRLRWGRLVYEGRRRSREFWHVEPGVGRVADGVPRRLDRLSALGDSLVPQIAEAIGREIVRWEERWVS